MKTYLLTWNPEKSDWKKREDYKKSVDGTQNGKIVFNDWSCGNTKTIQLGDRVFLLRQGKKNPEMIGSGIVSELLHEVNSTWRWQIGVDWDVLLPIDKVLPRNRLLKGLLPRNLVNAQRSGYEIGQGIAADLEKE